MSKNKITPINQSFLENVSEVLAQARKNAKTAVNLAMVYAYYEIGRMIVEEEQNGQNRAAYGKQILQELSKYLSEKYGKGYSAENLKLMRRFYNVYLHDQIGETVFTQFENLPAVSTGRKFYLSWSHYLKLMRIDNIDERHFYEIESVKNDWSLAELKRQYGSSLYERLALSTDKDKVYRLALEGQKVEKAEEAVKDPYVLEFLGLKELPDENPTIGIILCRDKNNAVVEMTLPEDNTQIFASKYETVLPSKEALQKLLEEQLSDENGSEDDDTYEI